MSQKTGKKLRKRADDESETCIKLFVAEVCNIPLKKNTVENETQEQEDVKIVQAEDVEEPEATNVTDGTHIIKQDEQTVEVNEVIVDQKETTKSEILSEYKQTVEEENSKIISNGENTEAQNTVDENEDIKASEILDNKASETPDNKASETPDNKASEIPDIKVDENESKSITENELEPLLLESEDVDPELEFDENSDVDSQKSSPIIRCRTRRSQTRNIPTPKTPKAIDVNSDDKASECSDKPSVLTVPTPEITDTESELSVFKPVTDICDTNEKLHTNTVEESFDSFQNVSTKAIVGNDTTRNVDFNSYPDDEFELSPFLIQSRERSVGESLKLLSSRRSIRSTKEYMLQNNNKRDYKTSSALPKRNTVEKLGGIKRKNYTDSSNYSKRFKAESPGLFSYISSPIVNFKNRFIKSEIPSSTPKLTGYKAKNVFDNTNMSKITLDVTFDETGDVTEKKWCTVM